MQITSLNEENRPDVLAYLRRLRYRNAMLLSNVTQLRQQCDVLVAYSESGIFGVATHYRALPFLNLAFAVEHNSVLPPLLAAIGETVPALRSNTVSGVMPEARAMQLIPFVQVESLEYELQMVVEPETLRGRSEESVRRLSHGDLPAMGELAEIGMLMAWRPDVLNHGPAFGVFADDRLVAMAATHFATAEVIEIGNITTHPGYRRRGYAAACTSALTSACFGLAPRVYLMVMANNTPAYATYRSLGFQALERFAFISFRLEHKHHQERGEQEGNHPL